MLSFSEMLKGKQHKLDKNKNGKLDQHDFKLLRKEEQELEEASKSGEGKVETKKYSWGTMKTVHHGSEFSVPLHPEHHQAIAKLKDNQEHKFKDETGRHWTAKRMGDKVHIHGANDGGKTVVNHSDLKEENSCGCSECSCNNTIEEKSDQARRNKTMKNMMDASRGAKFKLNNPVPDAEPQHKTAQAHNKAIGRALRKEEIEDLDEVAKASGDLKDACWKGYTAVGMKMKNGKKVPNCVPIKEEDLDEASSFVKGVKRFMAGKKNPSDVRDAHLAKSTFSSDPKVKEKEGRRYDKVQGVLSKEEVELEEKMDMSKADMGDVIKDFKKSDAPQFAGKSMEKRRQMAIAAKLQADRMKKEGVEMKSYKQFMEQLVDKLPQLEESVDVGDSDEASDAEHKHASKTKPTHEFKTSDGAHHKIWHHTDKKGNKSTLIHTKEPGVGGAPVMKLDQAGHHHPDDIKKSIHSYMNEDVEQIDELDKNLIKSIMKNPMPARPKTSSDEIDKSTGKLKPYGYRGKSEYEKSETGDDEEPKKRGRKAGVSVGTYKRR